MNTIITEDLAKVKNNLVKFAPKIRSKNFLITGGAGFIGSWFIDVLDSFGANITCVDNLISGSKKNIKNHFGKKNFKFINYDVCKFKPTGKIDYIIHMASIATPGIYQKQPIETLDSNLLGTKKMLELARKNDAPFLLTSTSEVYGNPDDAHIPTKEDYYGNVNSYGPRSMYDEAKRGAEAYAYSFFLKYPKMHIRIARIFNTYGPRLDVESTSQYGRALIKFIWQAINNKPITIYSDGKQTRAFCYITDQLTGLFNLLLTPKIDGEVINIGNSKEYSITDLVGKIINVSGSKSKIIFGSPPNYDLKDDPRRRCPNLGKAKKLLNYKPSVDLETGLTRTTKWIREEI
jgi:UDP-glucuronate decarboxylase